MKPVSTKPEIRVGIMLGHRVEPRRLRPAFSLPPALS